MRISPITVICRRQQPRSATVFAVISAVGDPTGEDFRGDGEKPGCFFAAFNSDISERCSILHTSRKLGLVAHGSGHRPARRQGSGKAIVDQPAVVSPKGRRATRVARQGRDRCIARRPLLGGRARIFKIEDHRVDVEGQRLLDPPCMGPRRKQKTPQTAAWLFSQGRCFIAPIMATITLTIEHRQGSDE